MTLQFVPPCCAGTASIYMLMRKLRRPSARRDQSQIQTKKSFGVSRPLDLQAAPSNQIMVDGYRGVGHVWPHHLYQLHEYEVMEVTTRHSDANVGVACQFTP